MSLLCISEFHIIHDKAQINNASIVLKYCTVKINLQPPLFGALSNINVFIINILRPPYDNVYSLTEKDYLTIYKSCSEYSGVNVKWDSAVTSMLHLPHVNLCIIFTWH